MHPSRRARVKEAREEGRHVLPAAPVEARARLGEQLARARDADARERAKPWRAQTQPHPTARQLT